ncbi:MAG: hypothetical protein K2X29_12110 [Candidatus Obscuribacterales bacterium]|nr:hypothetical protein [Candidatus Obscuribacterales bacterium]
MSTEIKLLESIRDKLDTGFQLLAGQIGETNVRIGSLETGLGAKIDATNARIGSLETGLVVRIDETNARLGNVERQLEVTNHQLDTLVQMQSDSSITLSSRADKADKRIGSLEHRVDKLEDVG